MTASRIASCLYQGSRPPAGHELHTTGVHTVVLCAIEHQPPSSEFPGVEVIRCPFDDSLEALDPHTWALIERTAQRVTERVRHKQRVLVTCRAGRNRSGLVTALALTRLYQISGSEAVRWVKEKRELALTNPAFVRRLEEAAPARRRLA